MKHLLDRLQCLDILVLDDSRSMRELLRTVLRGLWIPSPREAADVATAFAELRRKAPDIIVADWEMPPPDGIHFVRSLRGLPDDTLRRIPVLMVTAHTERWRINAARDAGVNEFLAKPVTLGGLADRILAMLEQPRDFVAASGFRGPCRRRQHVPFAGQERRVATTTAPNLAPLRSAWAACVERPGAAAPIERLFAAADMLREEGARRGYPLVTGVATSLCRVIEHGHASHRAGWITVEAHLGALSAILEGRLTGSGGAFGRGLLLGLRDRVEEGAAAMRLLEPCRAG
jgi:CheY-like chemotaxis protein